MRLCNDGEISSVVLIITTIKSRGWEGGWFCNAGIVLSWGAMLAEVSIFVAAVLCGIPAYCLSIINRNICCVIDKIPLPIYLYTQQGWHISEIVTER